MQSDGKVIITGNDTSYNSTPFYGILRFNSAGGIDKTFNVGTGFDSTPRTLQVRNDDKTFVAGNFTTYNGTSVKPVVLLNTDGTLDSSFVAGITDTSCTRVRLQSDGKILIACGSKLRRLNSDGTLDTTFTPQTFSLITEVKLLSDGKYLIQDSSVGLMRLNADGSKDISFYVPASGSITTIIDLSATDYWLGGTFQLYDESNVLNSIVLGPP